MAGPPEVLSRSKAGALARLATSNVVREDEVIGDRDVAAALQAAVDGICLHLYGAVVVENDSTVDAVRFQFNVGKAGAGQSEGGIDHETYFDAPGDAVASAQRGIVHPSAESHTSSSRDVDTSADQGSAGL